MEEHHFGKCCKRPCSDRRPVGVSVPCSGQVTETRWTSICRKREIVRRPRPCLQTEAREWLQGKYGFDPCRIGAAVDCLDSREPFPESLNPHCRHWTLQYANNRIELDHRSIKRRLRAMQGPRTLRTARRVIQGIEAVHIIRKGQMLGTTRASLATHSLAFALLLGII